MTIVTLVNCDNCGQNIASHDGGETLFRLELRVKNIPSTSPIRYSAIYYPPDAHGDFCNESCLTEWLTNRIQERFNDPFTTRSKVSMSWVIFMVMGLCRAWSMT